MEEQALDKKDVFIVLQNARRMPVEMPMPIASTSMPPCAVSARRDSMVAEPSSA